MFDCRQNGEELSLERVRMLKAGNRLVLGTCSAPLVAVSAAPLWPWWICPSAVAEQELGAREISGVHATYALVNEVVRCCRISPWSSEVIASTWATETSVSFLDCGLAPANAQTIASATLSN